MTLIDSTKHYRFDHEIARAILEVSDGVTRNAAGYESIASQVNDQYGVNPPVDSKDVELFLVHCRKKRLTLSDFRDDSFDRTHRKMVKARAKRES